MSDAIANAGAHIGCSLLFTDGYVVFINLFRKQKNTLLVLQLLLRYGNNRVAMLFHLISDCKKDHTEMAEEFKDL